MSSKDPLASASEGATKGVLDWSEEKIKGLVERFKNKDIAFVQDPETINLAKEQRKTSEWNLFKEYVDDPDLHILFQLGLTLRKLERQQPQVIALRSRILEKYDTRGLHIAQFIQNGFFGKFLGNILERTSTPEALKFEIKSFFDNIENTVVFVKESDNEAKKTEEVTARILAHSPKTFIICSSGSATEKCKQIKERVMRKISGYTTELYQAQYKEIYFINKSQESLK
jgi:hypothetical protein